jgi:hypothetical protein
LERLQKENSKLSNTLENKQEKLSKFKTSILLLWQRNKENLGAKSPNYEIQIKQANT